MTTRRIIWLAVLVLSAGGWYTANDSITPPLSSAAAGDKGERAPAPDFEKDGRSFLAKHCLHCHGGKSPKADLSFQGFKDASSLKSARQTWEHMLHMVESGEMPPAERPRPSDTETASFTRLIRVALFDGASRPASDRVTLRRLNRAEYENTIRDLVGIDVNPTEDFPEDDSAHGFDNIGDSLTLSPVLLERYLSAADDIVRQAIAFDAVDFPFRPLDVNRFAPAGAKVEASGFRRMSTNMDAPAHESGPLITFFRVVANAEYILRLRVYGQTTGKESPRFAFLLTGRRLEKPDADEEVAKLSGKRLETLKPLRIMQTFEVKATLEKTAETFDIKFTCVPETQLLAIAMHRPSEGEPDATLFVGGIELKGPFDSRRESRQRLLSCSADKPRGEQTREILTRFASRAFRRPTTREEVERLASLVDAAVARGETWEAGIQTALCAVLVSPKFLFRVELDDRSKGKKPQPIDEYHLASRMSYFLWSSMPDDELFELARKKELSAHIDDQVLRMIKDRKSNALFDNFAMQWLQLRRLKRHAPDTRSFPAFDEPLRSAMLMETELFFEAIMREDRSILELIDADFTFLNEPLARLYGIVDTNGNRAGRKHARDRGDAIRSESFRRVSLQDHDRGGILTQASVLTATSNPTRTSPVKRGRWILEQILGTPPPPPPPNVPELEDTGVLTGSLRQRTEQHRSKESCAACHARMDPIGFALENFDAIGAYRTKDGEFPIDSTGTLPNGVTFKGPVGLKKMLTGKKELFGRCLTEKMLIYALGRGLKPDEQIVVDQIVQKLAQKDYRFSILATEIVKSEPFRLREGKDQQ